MRGLVVIFSVLTSISVWAIDLRECTYCGGWVPTGSSTKYVRQAVSTVGLNSVAFPSCQPVAVELLKLIDNVREIVPPPDAASKPLTAIYRVAAKPACKFAYQGLTVGSVFTVQLLPRSSDPSWDQMKLSVYLPSVTLDAVLHGGDILEYLPSKPGMKQKVKRRPAPQPAVEWWFMRDGHNPCDEGTRSGERICDGWAEP
jgi:hypothetical protein